MLSSDHISGLFLLLVVLLLLVILVALLMNCWRRDESQSADFDHEPDEEPQQQSSAFGTVMTSLQIAEVPDNVVDLDLIRATRANRG